MSITFDFSDFDDFADWLESSEAEEIMQKIALRVITNWRNNAILLSPVADKNGGTLRKSWHREDVQKKGGAYESTLYNNAVSDKGAPYPLYVNYGHRVGKDGWVEGQFFLEDARDEVQSEMQNIYWTELIRWWSNYGK